MTREHGFVIKISVDDIFIPQKSSEGADMVAAYDDAVRLRQKIIAAFADVPVGFKVSEPIGVTRKAKSDDAASMDPGPPNKDDPPLPLDPKDGKKK